MKKVISKNTFVNPEGKMKEITVGVNFPNVPVAKKITKEDVWGTYEPEHSTNLVDRGMIIAQGYTGKIPSLDYLDWMKKVEVPGICPVWNDRVPYKSVTVICEPEQEAEVMYWLEYVHGGGSVSNRCVLQDGKIALRSDYQCW